MEVYINGVRVAVLKTATATAHNQVLLWVPRFSSTQTGPLVLRQNSTAPVIVDAVVIRHL